MNQIAAIIAPNSPTPSKHVQASTSAPQDSESDFEKLLATESATEVPQFGAPLDGAAEDTQASDPIKIVASENALLLINEGTASSKNIGGDEPQSLVPTLQPNQIPSDVAGIPLVFLPAQAEIITSHLANPGSTVSIELNSDPSQRKTQLTETQPNVNTDQIPSTETEHFDPLVAQAIANLAPRTAQPLQPSRTGTSKQEIASPESSNPSTAMEVPAQAVGGKDESSSVQQPTSPRGQHQQADSQPRDASKIFDSSATTQQVASNPSANFSTALLEVQTAQANSHVPLAGLAVHIVRKFEQGSSQFEINLHPADLGKLDITISVAQDGRVHAVLRAERADTLDLLQRDSRALEQQLRQAGLEVGSNALSFQLSSGGNQRQAVFQESLRNSRVSAGANSLPEEVKVNYIAVHKRDGVDIHV